MTVSHIMLEVCFRPRATRCSACCRSIGPLSGYDLKRWADHSLRYFFWSPAQSAIYSELRRLEDLGYVRTVGSTEGPRARQRYRITAAGRRALAAWVASSTPPPIVKDHALLKVWLGHVTDVDTVRSVVDSERKAAEDLLGEIRYSAARAEEVGDGPRRLWSSAAASGSQRRASSALRELSDGAGGAGDREDSRMTRNPHVGEPFTDDDARSPPRSRTSRPGAAVLAGAHDGRSVVDPWRHPPARMRTRSTCRAAIPADEQAEVRRRAVPAIAAYRDARMRPARAVPRRAASR